MKTLRILLAAAALGLTLGACAAEGPTAPARTPGHRAADGSSDSTTATTGQNSPGSPSSTPPAPLPGDPPPPDDRGGQITGPGA
ncbi:MAG TPA: hypothetical protein VGB15_02525 [Longimicrobium sp.]|jgi:hypothetical protein